MSVRSLRNGWSAVTVSVLLHGAIALLAIAAYLFIRKPPPQDVRLAIDATVVTAVPQQAARPAPPALEPSLPPVEEEDLAAEQRAAEKRAEEKREAEQLAARERAEEKRRADEKKEADEKAAQLKAAQEKAAKDKADREKAAQDKLVREKALAEQQRAQREADLNAQIAAEERVAAARASGQMSQYIAQITAKIERNWNQLSAQPGLNCEVRVNQGPGGIVLRVEVGRCNGDDSVRQSIEAAVYKASPLPLPSDPALFERDLVVTFRPEI